MHRNRSTNQVHRLLRSICTCKAAAPATLSKLMPTFLSGLVLLKISWVEKNMHRVFSTRKRVCAEYAQSMRRVCADLFPRERRRDPRHAGQLGKSRERRWGVSERISWTVQATESSSSVGRAQKDSTQRGGPRKAAEEAKPIGDGAVSIYIGSSSTPT